jgi:cation transport ATPase
VKAKKLSHAVMKNIKKPVFLHSYKHLGIQIAAEFCIRFSEFCFPMIAALAMSFSSVSIVQMHCV